MNQHVKSLLYRRTRQNEAEVVATQVFGVKSVRRGK